jgi:hypothetical protein
MIKRKIQEQKLDAKVLDGKVLLNGHKYRLSIKDPTFGWVNVNVEKLTPLDKTWEITAGKLWKKETKTIPQDAVEIIAKKVGLPSIQLRDKENKEYKLVKETKMKKIVKLTESDLNRLVKKVLNEQEQSNYMFFSNLEQIKRQCEMMLEMDHDMIDKIIQDGHDWADDHISEAKTNMDQVFDFFKNQMSKESDYLDYEDINEGRKKTGTKLCARGLAAAKGKFKVHPSAYSNGYGVQVCKGKMPGLDGKKHCSGSYC